MDTLLDTLAKEGDLTSVLSALTRLGATATLKHVWDQGEFHHDVVLEYAATPARDAAYLVVATNCNGGVKEVIAFKQIPDRWALWHWRCPDSPEFAGELPTRLGWSRTHRWFEPCVLLADDARSELRPEHRVRQHGGGWCMAGTSASAARDASPT
ncbi:MAG: hypothetical protein IV100_06835 [Myxococcales bacterium]|nr:hypothetical protein [Myxococcales bacterium]